MVTNEILKATARVFDISPRTICGCRRTEKIALARQVAMYLLLQKDSRCTLREVGQAVGGRCPSTVCHAYVKISERIEYDSELLSILGKIEILLGNTPEKVNGRLYICQHCGSPVKVLHRGDGTFPSFILDEQCQVCSHYGAIPLMHKKDADMSKLLEMLITPPAPPGQ